MSENQPGPTAQPGGLGAAHFVQEVLLGPELLAAGACWQALLQVLLTDTGTAAASQQGVPHTLHLQHQMRGWRLFSIPLED